MLVGEQPGDEEDKSGQPFIGPAGQVLNKALAEAGIDRQGLYVTNAVKHFKFRIADGQRYHRSPNLQDIVACKPWLEAELNLVKPELVVCLGVSAARSLISPGFTLKEGRGQLVRRGEVGLVPTYHPSAVLRGEDAEAIYSALVKDLRLVKSLAA